MTFWRWPASAGTTSPIAASERASRATRCAARSSVVHPSHSVGASGPNFSNVSHIAARSASNTLVALIALPPAGSGVAPELDRVAIRVVQVHARREALRTVQAIGAVRTGEP